jgi:hypothetical protein
MTTVYSIYMRAYALHVSGSSSMAKEALLNGYDDGETDKLALAAAALGYMHASMELDLYGLKDFNDMLDRLFDVE